MLSPDEMKEINSDLEDILMEAVKRWHAKSYDYNDAFLELGAKGQFSEIWRKVKKLEMAVWYGIELTGDDDAEQIAKEIIPHCLMMVYCLRHRRGMDKTLPSARPS